ncbi:MAG: AraC family transcriptional regulator [Chloroflexi bacterium]|nr:AraC family transcriptional regulator [Chloroflexota bacterium]
MNDVLSRIHLAGAIFLRAEYTAPWACESPSANELMELLRSKARRLVLFHIIAEGSCWIRLRRGDYVEAQQGDVLVLPYADKHAMGVAEHPPPVPISSLLPAPPWQELPVIRHGGGGGRTSVVCGYLECDAPIFEPVVNALPPVFTVRPPTGPAADWVNASIEYALDASGLSSARASLALRLPELLFLEVLRLYMQSGPPELTGWLAALHDPIAGRALTELHNEPARAWTLDELARRSACSRSTLNARFTRLVGRAPMQYLAEWRLQLAAELLQKTTLGVAAVAYRVGYESEAAFNRAFKRAIGKPPARWRTSAA